jgi:hypothetical protein
MVQVLARRQHIMKQFFFSDYRNYVQVYTYVLKFGYDYLHVLLGDYSVSLRYDMRAV